MESKLHYLGMIQSVISRMASNSFLLKGWTVTLVVGLLAFANIKSMDSKYTIIALIPAIIFWILDGYFLNQELLYRKLYARAAKLKKDEEVNFSLNAKVFEKEFDWLEAIFSTTLSLFYVPIIFVILLVLFMF